MGSKLPLSFVEVAQHAVDAGWKGWQVVDAVAIAKAESGHDAYAIGVVGAPERTLADGTVEPNPAYRSLDVGLWQINSFWHPAQPIVDMLDPAKNAAYAFKMWTAKFESAPGDWADRVHAAWRQWAVYKAGMHVAYKSAAVDAARAVGAI